MIFRLYKNNDELWSTNARTIDDALWHFINKNAIPEDVLEKLGLDEFGLTAVMPSGDVWQVRSLIENLMGWRAGEGHKCNHKGCTSRDTEQFDLGTLGKVWLCKDHVRGTIIAAGINFFTFLSYPYPRNTALFCAAQIVLLWFV